MEQQIGDRVALFLSGVSIYSAESICGMLLYYLFGGVRSSGSFRADQNKVAYQVIARTAQYREPSPNRLDIQAFRTSSNPCLRDFLPQLRINLINPAPQSGIITWQSFQVVETHVGRPLVLLHSRL